MFSTSHTSSSSLEFNVQAGVYPWSVADANGCTLESVVSVEQPSAFTFNLIPYVTTFPANSVGYRITAPGITFAILKKFQ